MEQTSQCSALAEIASRSWRPAPAIRASVAFHVSALAAFAFEPVSWPYIGAALAGNHAMLAIAGMWPRSALLGPNITRLPQEAIERREIALTFDDGPNPSVTPRVLDVLDRYNVKASFFCVGERAAAHPALVRDIARRGHSIENHTHTHPAAFAAYGIGRLRREIESAQYTIASICGRAPVFFRAPIGIRNPLLDPVLAKLGLKYVSWTRRGFDTVHPDAGAVCERLGQNLRPGDVLALHDREAVVRHSQAPAVLTALPRLLERFVQERLSGVTLPAAWKSEPASLACAKPTETDQ